MKSLLLPAAGLLVPLLIGFASLSRVPEGDVDIDVRTVPWRTQAGGLQAAVPMGQGFRPAFDGLRRIDVALVAQGEVQGTTLGLVLRKDSPEGEVLRRVQASELPAGRGWGRFDFAPIEDSAGQAYWWQLELSSQVRQSSYSPLDPLPRSNRHRHGLGQPDPQWPGDSGQARQRESRLPHSRYLPACAAALADRRLVCGGQPSPAGRPHSTRTLGSQSESV